jgi:hypothetical protein
MNGLIAFFDILGYQSFLENNSATQSAEKVLKLITEIPEQTKSEVSKRWFSLYENMPAKDIPQSVDTKASNTVKLVRRLILSMEEVQLKFRQGN